MSEAERLVSRLRETASKGVSVWGDLQIEAANEIEILTAERESYANSMARMETDIACWKKLYDEQASEIERLRQLEWEIRAEQQTRLDHKDAEIERLTTVIESYKADQIEGIEISVKQQAEIERLKDACAKEFDSVQELDCKLGVANDLLRQALGALEVVQPHEVPDEDVNATIAAIKQHLGEA